MDDVHVTSCILVNTSSVGLERGWVSDSTCNGSALVDLLHHGLLAGDRSVLIHVVHSVLIGDEAGATTGLAVLAHVDWGTDNSIVEASCLVDGTSLISDVVCVHELEGAECLSTMATSVISGARDDDLR